MESQKPEGLLMSVLLFPLRAYESNPLASFVFVIGLTFILAFIPKFMNSSLSDPFRGVVIQKLSPWRQTLMGETISLPSADEQGFAISRETSHIVYSMPCSSCSKLEDIDKYLIQSVKKPFILIFVGEWEEVPALFKNRPNDYLILCDKEANYAPKDFLSHAPQIARINSEGIITEVPKENEELSEFLKRGDAK
jgi:hypothetical protein